MDKATFAKNYLPEVTVDVVLLSISSTGSLLTLLTKREEEPFKGDWALPGVFVRRNETLGDAAARALKEKSGIAGDVFVEQLYTFGDVNRDPRGRIISVAYYALVPEGRFETARSRAETVETFQIDVSAQEPLVIIVRDEKQNAITPAFDHSDILIQTVARIRGKLNYTNIGFELLPDKFTLFELQRIHEAVLGRKLNKDSFRRRMLASGLIEDTGERRGGTAYRPAALYQFKKEDKTHG